jgi:uncharacterized membrane protein
MEVLLFNTGWMLWNLMLAYLSIYLGRFTYQSKKLSEKIIAGVLWLLFVPNTIYILTDLYHITYQIDQVTGLTRAVLYLQYLLFIPFGILTFVYSMSFFDRTLKKLNGTRIPLLIAINFLIGIGITVGRIQRTNSWDIFFAPIKTFNAILDTLTLPYLLIPSILFGILCNIIYFTYRKALVKS